MYLPLENWGHREWNKLYDRYDLTHLEKREVRQILTMPTKEGVKLWKDRLIKLWLVNWLWPWWFPAGVRTFFTEAFPYLDFFYHDIAYLIAINKEDRKKADIGWLKYAKIEIGSKYSPKLLVAYIWYCLLRVGGRFSTNY